MSDAPVSVIIYVLCYDERSHSIAQKKYAHEPWARILWIESTPYLESIVYSHYLPALVHEWGHKDYVGTVAYSADTKVKLPRFTALCQHLDTQRPDVVPLFAIKNKRLLQQAMRNHPQFYELWSTLLSHLFPCVPPVDVQNTEVPLFLCNYWLASTEWMHQYLTFFRRAQHVLDTCPELQPGVWSDARYSNKLMPVERLVKIFGRPHYTYHAFLCERLPCFFFWFNGATIMPMKKHSV